MSGTHQGLDSLVGSTTSPLHRLDPRVKLTCLVVFVLAVVATPVRTTWAFATFTVLVLSVAALARLPLATLARRLAIEIPFLAFALAMPFLGAPPHSEVLGVSVSNPGSWGAANIVVKALICGAAGVVLAWSTPVADLLTALERLRVPRILVVVTGFMVRYLDVVTGELRRMQIARTSRADDPRWLWQGRAVAATAGTLFVRSFERGERVQQAMVARGFDGRLPGIDSYDSPGSDRHRDRIGWWPAVAWPTVAAMTAVVAGILTR